VNILITGAAGFIGSHIARQLVRDGHEVHAVVRPQTDLRRITDIKSSLHFIHGDLLDSSFILSSSSFGELLDRPDLIKLGAFPWSPSESMHILADNTKLREGTGWKTR